MGPILAKLATPTLMSWATHIDDMANLSAYSTHRQTIRIRETVRGESQKVDCKNHKLKGLDLGPCGNPFINYSSISLILLFVVAFCIAGYKKTARSRSKDSADVLVANIPTAVQEQQNEREAREMQAHAVQQTLEDERRRGNNAVREARDRSDQQIQPQRLEQLRAQLVSKQIQWDIEAVAGQNEVRSPDTAHVRDRVEEWEQYLIRPDQDITDARLERASSIGELRPSFGERIRSIEPQNRLDISRQADQVLEPLPAYAPMDPLATQTIAPAYNV